MILIILIYCFKISKQLILKHFPIIHNAIKTINPMFSLSAQNGKQCASRNRSNFLSLGAQLMINLELSRGDRSSVGDFGLRPTRSPVEPGGYKYA